MWGVKKRKPPTSALDKEKTNRAPELGTATEEKLTAPPGWSNWIWHQEIGHLANSLKYFCITRWLSFTCLADPKNNYIMVWTTWPNLHEIQKYEKKHLENRDMIRNPNLLATLTETWEWAPNCWAVPRLLLQSSCCSCSCCRHQKFPRRWASGQPLACFHLVPSLSDSCKSPKQHLSCEQEIMTPPKYLSPSFSNAAPFGVWPIFKVFLVRCWSRIYYTSNPHKHSPSAGSSVKRLKP